MCVCMRVLARCYGRRDPQHSYHAYLASLPAVPDDLVRVRVRVRVTVRVRVKVRVRVRVGLGLGLGIGIGLG